MIKGRLFLFTLLATSVSSIHAAQSFDIERQNLSILSNITTKELTRNIDPAHNTHVRLQQTYEGLRVWNGDIIVHIPYGDNTLLTNTKRATLSGQFYQDLQKDLLKQSKTLANVNREQMALEAVVHAAKSTLANIQNKKSELLIYVDQNDKAHYAYLISFFTKQNGATPSIPTFIVDAETFKIYEQWDNLQTQSADGGGFGGNPKMGKLTYDGLNHLGKLDVDRVDTQCFLRNADVTVKDVRASDAVMNYSCKTKDAEHNNLYWSGDFDAANGAYSPANDALYTGFVIKQMYQQWYGIPVLTDANGPMMLNMRVHEDMENAYWDGSQMTFGDGGGTFYPLVSLGVGAHEISHGFTQQHSNLTYRGQSGGLNESFSDMAAMAAEFYSTGKSSWMIGAEITKSNFALRYMDEPTKDCGGSRMPGQSCSISDARDYHIGLNVHYSSGVFNKAFYLIATTPGWDTRKAFDVMVEANRFYWTANNNFTKAACGVLAATAALHYTVSDVNNALLAVGINTSRC